MQISLHSLQKVNTFPDDFPYEALSPYTGSNVTFNNIDDVYRVIFECYNECKQKGFSRMGEALYEQALMFVNMDKLIDQDSQMRIREYQFCKDFNCPPYPSLKETPANVVDDFSVIQEEMIQYSTKEKNGSK